jgi:hypothetical protein
MTEYPTMECPRCGDVTEDLDGFGPLICDRCGWCSHPSSTGDVCDACGHSAIPAARAKRILEQAGWDVALVDGFAAAVDPPGYPRWRIDRGLSGSSGLTDGALADLAARHLPAIEQMALEDA